MKMMGIALSLTLLFGVSLLWQIHGSWQRLAYQNHDHGTSSPSPRVRLSPASRSESTDAPKQGSISDERISKIPSHVAREIQWLTRRLLLTTAGVAVLGMLVALWLTRLCTRPIHELISAVRMVKEGNYTARAPVRALDEIGELSAAFNDMAATLGREEEQRRHLRGRVIAAVEDERKRLARDLHDHTGQALTSLVVGLAALEANPDKRQAGELRMQAVQILEEVHLLSTGLRPSVLDDLGLAAALRKHCAGVDKRFGVHTNCGALQIGDGERFSSETEVTVYRIVQEAVNNAIRHGRAQSIDVVLKRRNGSLIAAVEDDGCGFDASDWRHACLREGNLGLLGIEERVALLHGCFFVESRPRTGTRILVEIPLEGEQHGSDSCSDS